jgi:hypothetical protein
VPAFAVPRELAVELTAITLHRCAPDELPVLDEVATEYFADPAAALAEGRDQALGSGLEIAMITPYVLEAAGVVLPVLGAMAGDALKQVGAEQLTAMLRRLFRRGPADPPRAEALSRAQATEVRRAVLGRLRQLGVGDAQAALVADATIGSLHVRG